MHVLSLFLCVLLSTTKKIGGGHEDGGVYLIKTPVRAASSYVESVFFSSVTFLGWVVHLFQSFVKFILRSLHLPSSNVKLVNRGSTPGVFFQVF